VLESLIHDLRLSDAWDVALNPQAFTHYSPTLAARPDRIYVTEDLWRNKQGVETIAAAFTEYLIPE